MRIRSTITAAALAVIAVACTVGCGSAADATSPTVVTRDPATTPTVVERPRDPASEFDRYVRASAPSYGVNTARMLAQTTCDLLTSGTSPEIVIDALIQVANENGRNLRETGNVIRLGIVTWCPERIDEFMATGDRMLAELDS